MGELERIVNVVFQGDDRTAAAMQSVRGGLGQLGAIADTAAQPLAKMFDGVVALDGALVAFAGGALALAYTKSMQFQSSQIELQKVTGDIPGYMDKATEAAFRLSDQYGVSAEKILLSTANFAQAGFDAEDALLLTKNAMDLVIAGGVDAAKSSEILVASLKGFRAPAEDAGRLLDILNKVSNEYATDVEQLGIGMAAISPIARTMGFSMEETAGLLTPVIEIFRSGDEAAIALKTGLLKLVDNTKPVQDALASIGVSQTDANGALRSGKDILLDVAKAFTTLDENQKLFITQQLVGIDQSARMVEVFDNIRKYSDITATAMGAAGSAAEEVALRLKSSQVAVDRFAQGFVNLSIAMGIEFREAATGAINGGTEIENALRQALGAGSFDPLFETLRELSEKMEVFLRGITAALPEALENVDWSGFLDALGDLGRSVSDLFGALDLTDPEDLAKALQGVVDGMEALTRITKGMWETLSPFFDAIRLGVQEVKNMDAVTLETFGNFLGAAKLVVEAGALMGVGFLAISKSGVDIGNIFNIVAGTIQAVVNGAQLAFDLQAQFLLKLLDVLTFVPEKLSGIIPGMGKVHDALVEGRESLDSWFDAISLHRNEQASELIGGLSRAWAGVTGDTYEAKTATDDYNATLTRIPDEIWTKLSLDGEGQDLIDWSKNPEIKDIIVTTVLDETSAAKAVAKVEETVFQAIEKKPLEVKVDPQVNLAKIKEVSDIVQKSIEWKAKLDIAEVEANAKRVEAAFGSIGEGIKSTGDLLGDLFGQLGDASAWDKLNIESQIDAENDRRQQEFDLQKKLVESEIALNEEKLAKMERGESLITIQGDGLQPHLEAFMWEILSAIQVRANEEASEFLLGI